MRWTTYCRGCLGFALWLGGFSRRAKGWIAMAWLGPNCRQFFLFLPFLRAFWGLFDILYVFFYFFLDRLGGRVGGTMWKAALKSGTAGRLVW